MVLNKNKESKWFEKSLKKSVRSIYIPKEIFEKLNLKNSDTIAVRIRSNKQNFMYPVRVSKRDTPTGLSFSFNIPPKFKNLLNNDICVKIMKLEEIENYLIKFNKKVIKVKSKEFIITNWLESDNVVIWSKHTGYRTNDPIITHKVLKLNKTLLSYLGLYMTDGNKKRNYKLFASTKDIFNLAINGYRDIILNPSFSVVLNYDKFVKDKRVDSTIIKDVKSHWEKVIPNVDSIKIEISTRRLNTLKKSKARLPFGSVFIKDNRTLSGFFHVFLIKCVLKKFKDDKDALTYFFVGGALGDFYPSIRPRNKAFNWLEIATNKEEVYIWKNICTRLKFNYKEKIREGNSVLLCVHGYFNVISLLKKGLFKQYGKRREKTVNGLKNRIETYIFNAFKRSSKKTIDWKDEFLNKTNSFFIVNKGLDLVKNKLVKFNKRERKVTITNKGHIFIKDLLKLNILEE
ncbi:hypothetical protein CMO93_00750 [Candidatus Woesearchaeota archaeon]|nr:hypothetical protein [Candidatus Woesearchaeota archaeon]|tara:strand:- start:1204 stop:2577 length:1374 start_codon:yes stop_codon:yes gene_type:complete